MSEFFLIVGVALFVVFFFGFCIFIHELGHFLVGKWRGLHIVAFSIGFRKIWGFKYKGVDFRIGWIPFGGYVDLPQIDTTGEPTTEDGTPLPRAKPIDRILTALAGPLCNLLFGFVLGVVIWIHGIPQDTPKMEAITVAEVDKVSPEYEAGLREGDVIVKVNGERFYSTWNDIVRKIIFTIGQVKLDVVRDGKEMLIKYVPRENPKVMPNEKIPYPFFTPKIPVILYPMPDSPAAAAGIKPGDLVVSVNGEKVRDVRELQYLIEESGGAPLRLVVKRDDTEKRFILKPIFDEHAKNIFRIGVKYLPKTPIVVGEVLPHSPAAKAGLMADDVILTINGNKLATPGDFGKIIQASEGNPLLMEVERGNHILRKVVVAKLRRTHTIGVQFAYYNFPTPWRQFLNVIDMSYKTLRGIFSKKSKLKARHLSGPIGIVRVIGIAVYRGSIIQGLHIIVWISFSLAILNLLPIPVLDGGHILLAVIEMVIRRPLPEQLVKTVMYMCLALLISFMLYVSYYDARRTIHDFVGDRPSQSLGTSEDQTKTNENDASINVADGVDSSIQNTTK